MTIPDAEQFFTEHSGIKVGARVRLVMRNRVFSRGTVTTIGQRTYGWRRPVRVRIEWDNGQAGIFGINAVRRMLEP